MSTSRKDINKELCNYFAHNFNFKSSLCLIFVMLMISLKISITAALNMSSKYISEALKISNFHLHKRDVYMPGVINVPTYIVQYLKM